jgi:hypothetical protein
MDKRVAAGARAQINGGEYEDEVVIAFHQNQQQKQQVSTFAEEHLAIDLTKYKLNLRKLDPNSSAPKVASVLGTKKTTAKADLILEVNSLNSRGQNQEFGCSAKMNKRGIQIQICSFPNFWAYALANFKIVPTDRLIIVRGFEKTLGLNGFNPLLKENSKKIKLMQVERIKRKIPKAERKFHPKYYWFELTKREQEAMEKFLRTNARAILSLILKTGFCKYPRHHAEILITNKVSYTDTKSVDFSLKFVDDYIEEMLTQMTKMPIFTDKGNIQLGRIKLQMKGSGPVTSYHSMQFKS